LLRCLAFAALTDRARKREEEKEKAREREREREREKRKEKEKMRKRRLVQFEHSKSRWPVPTVSLLLATRVCRVVVLPSFGSELTRSARGVYFRSVTFTNICLAFAAVAARRSRNPNDATRSLTISRVDAT